MADVIDRLLACDNIRRLAAASPAQIEQVAGLFGAPVPELLVKLWERAGGVKLEGLDAHLLGPKELTKLIKDTSEEDEWGDEQPWGKVMVERGLLPFMDDHQSNYLALAVRGPRAPRVVFVPHDDSSRILYRDLGSCLEDLLEAMDGGETADSYFREAEGDYAPDAARTEADQAAARELLQTDEKNGDWNHAVRLLDAANLEEWARLLETDHFVRRDVRARLGQMKSKPIRELLRRDEQAFQAFANAAAEAVRAAGMKVGGQQGTVLQVGGCWMELEAFFHRRNIPNALPRLVAWFQDSVAARDPHERPGNFMVD